MQNSSAFQYLAIDTIHESTTNPRRTFDEGKLQELAVTLHSIRGLTPLIFQHCPLFHCRFIALKSRTFVVKSRTTFAIKFVHDLNAKSPPMGDCGRGCWGVAFVEVSRVSASAWPPSLRRRLASALAHTPAERRSMLRPLPATLSAI
jgi:hypothetical protein